MKWRKLLIPLAIGIGLSIPWLGASATTIQYQSTNEYTIRLDGDTLVVRVALPGAAAPSGHDVPTTIVTFTRQP